MNNDKAEGLGKTVAGKIQKTTGRLTGNRTQELKGLKTEIEGKVQSQLGEAKEAMEDQQKKLVRGMNQARKAKR